MSDLVCITEVFPDPEHVDLIEGVRGVHCEQMLAICRQMELAARGHRFDRPDDPGFCVVDFLPPISGAFSVSLRNVEWRFIGSSVVGVEIT